MREATAVANFSFFVFRFSLNFSFFVFLFSLFSCSQPDPHWLHLKDLAYDYHYRNLDSVEYYASHREGLFNGPDAEQLNNLAFVRIAKMQYDEAERLLDKIPHITDNQLELLVGYVQQMRLCQRRSRNREFHEFRQLADHALNRINEERQSLNGREQSRLLYAETEYAIVNSTYYYYVGLERQSIHALRQIDPNEVARDTAQWLNYLYNIGAGGILTEGTQQQINQLEFDHLMRCLLMARQAHYPFFEANALEALSEHLQEPEYREQLIRDNLPAMKFLNPEGVPYDELPSWLAEASLEMFRNFGDVYQTAGAYRTLASCCRHRGDYESALYYLEQSLADSSVLQAPDLVASIREQLSVAYSAIDDKPMSDVNRNLYIDLMADTRQDRSLEARASQYEATSLQLNWMLAAVLLAIVLMLFLLWLFQRLSRRQVADHRLDDLLEQREDELSMQRLQLENAERRHTEQRAKLSMVNSITPLIDRMLYEVNNHPDGFGTDTEYLRELTDKINEQNDVLTQWIQLRQGELSLKVETFPLQPLFDVIGRGRRSFELKGLTLNVLPTELSVKADRMLTLFMLNTLADNARKFTPEGGRVTVEAQEGTDYVELSVSDTGEGMTPEQLDHLFDSKPIHDPQNYSPSSFLLSPSSKQQSHGFGLLNCKGIIEKYRKTSSLFGVCRIAAESEVGKGSRLWFRLPKGIGRLVVWGICGLVVWGAGCPCFASDSALKGGSIFFTLHSSLSPSQSFADSAYNANLRGEFRETLRFADSCRHYLNESYRALQPRGRYPMLRLGNPSLVAPEIKWFHDSLAIDYTTILDIRNESAVAALALHEWQLYNYNNRIYTQLYKEMSADNTLADYCRVMQQSQQNKTIAVILLVLVLLSILPAFYILYVRPRILFRSRQESRQQNDLQLLDDELRRIEMETSRYHVTNAVLDNCLSSLKHETMYYPSRIRQLIDQGDLQSVPEVVSYYRQLYGLFSSQAMHQEERIPLAVRHIQTHGCDIIGNDNLVRWLFKLLPGEVTVVSDPEETDYVGFSIALSRQPQLFDLLICRQILRDHGEATNRRGCGLVSENENIINIKLPKYNGKVQSHHR